VFFYTAADVVGGPVVGGFLSSSWFPSLCCPHVGPFTASRLFMSCKANCVCACVHVCVSVCVYNSLRCRIRYLQRVRRLVEFLTAEAFTGRDAFGLADVTPSLFPKLAVLAEAIKVRTVV
jgi:hypothetical protein